MTAESSKSSPLCPHHAARIDLPGRYGPIAALHEAAAGDDSGATALLLPGFTGSKEDFAPLLDPISAAGITVLAVDLPGQYESPGPDLEDAYLPDALGQVVAELVGKLTADGQQVVVLGHSYGGLVARAAVLAGAPVAGLTLLGSGPGELPAGYRRAALEVGERILREDGLAAAQRARELQDAANPDWSDVCEEVREFRRMRFLRSSPAGLLGMADGLRHEPDRVTQLARALRVLDAACLVMCGESDDAWSVATQRDMAERLDADFAVVPGARHSPNTENPAGLLVALIPTWHAWLSR